MKDLNVLEQLRGKLCKVGTHTYILEDKKAYVVSNAKNERIVKVFEINPNATKPEDSIHHVKTPTASQYANALLNYIIRDNMVNESKKGIYSLSIADIYYEFLDTITDLEVGRTDSKSIITKFALNKKDETLVDLTDKVVKNYKKVEEVSVK